MPNGTHSTLDPIEGVELIQGSSDRAEPNVNLGVVYSLVYPQKVTLYQLATKPGYQPAGTSVGAEQVELGFGIENLLDVLDGSYCTDEETAHSIECRVYAPSKVTSISYGAGKIFYPVKQ